MSLAPPAPANANAQPFSRQVVLLGWLVLGLVLAVGCSDGKQSIQTTIRACADLSGARASTNEALRRAILVIEEQGELPRQLTPPPLKPSRNAAADLARAMNASLRVSLHEPLEALFYRDRFVFVHSELTRLANLRRSYKEALEAIEGAAIRPECQFEASPDFGYFAATDYLDNAATAFRLTLSGAVLAIEQNDLKQATSDTIAAIKWANWLDDAPRLEARLIAAQLRFEWLLMIEAIAEHPSTQRADYERLYLKIRETLANWPTSRPSLAGDRAATLHAYEALRVGLMDRVTTEEERVRLLTLGVDVAKPLEPKAIDRDQLAYLTAMQRVIDTSDRPFYQQANELAIDLKAFAKQQTIAPLATELFMPGMISAMEQMAIDRARCEVWAITLASAGGFDMPDEKTNPHTGREYQVERQPGSIMTRSQDAQIRDAFALIKK